MSLRTSPQTNAIKLSTRTATIVCGVTVTEIKQHEKGAARDCPRKNSYTKSKNYANLLLKLVDRLQDEPRSAERFGLTGVRQRAMQASASCGEISFRISLRQMNAALAKDGFAWEAKAISRYAV